MAHEITDATFQAEVLDSKQVTLIDLWAEWCGPCKAMNPIITELSAEYEGKALIAKIDVDNNPVTPDKFNVRGIPTFLFFKNGELAEKLVGATSKKVLKDKIDALLAEQDTVVTEKI